MRRFTVSMQLDLPFHFYADGKQQEMEMDEDYDFGPIMKMASTFAESGFGGLKNFSKLHKGLRGKRINRFKKRFGL